MDPNTTLARLRSAVAAWEQEQVPIDAVEDAIDAFRNLDEWLSKGGELPDAWNREG